MLQPGRLNKWVTLSKAPDSSPDTDGFFEDLVPPGTWVGIDPLPPASTDGTRLQGAFVTMRYRADITIDVRIVYGTRELFVKGVENVDEANRELRLYCEEAVS